MVGDDELVERHYWRESDIERVLMSVYRERD